MRAATKKKKKKKKHPALISTHHFDHERRVRVAKAQVRQKSFRVNVVRVIVQARLHTGSYHVGELCLLKWVAANARSMEGW